MATDYYLTIQFCQATHKLLSVVDSQNFKRFVGSLHRRLADAKLSPRKREPHS